MRDQKQSLQEQLSKLDSSISTNKKDIVIFNKFISMNIIIDAKNWQKK